MEFKIGDKVKLKDYSNFEYPQYRDQTAVIIQGLTVKTNFDWEIKWSDDRISFAKTDNLILVEPSVEAVEVKKIGIKKIKLDKKTENKIINYGRVELETINSNDELVPSDCQKIDLPTDDRQALALAIRKDKACLLVGETGTGKTSAVKELAYLLKQPYVRVNMTGFTTPDELIGSKSVKEGRTYFEYGIITDAMRRGAILVIDEINATVPDCLFILHGLLDDDRQVTLPNGEVIKPHKNFRVFATCNPDYEGTKSMNKAFLDRFPIIVEVDTLSPAKEEKLVMERTGVEKELANKLVTVGTMIRKDYFEGKITTYCSTRSLLNWAELIRAGITEKPAYITTIVKKTSDKEQQKILTDFFLAVFKMADTGSEDNIPTVITKGELKNYLERNDKLSKEIERLLGEMTAVKEDRSRALKRVEEAESTADSAKEQANRLGNKNRELEKVVETYKKLDSLIKEVAEKKQKEAV